MNERDHEISLTPSLYTVMIISLLYFVELPLHYKIQRTYDLDCIYIDIEWYLLSLFWTVASFVFETVNVTPIFFYLNPSQWLVVECQCVLLVWDLRVQFFFKLKDWGLDNWQFINLIINKVNKLVPIVNHWSDYWFSTFFTNA